MAEKEITAEEDAAAGGHHDHSHERTLSTDNSLYGLTFCCLVDKIRHDFKLTMHLDDYFYKCTMIFCIQVMLVLFIFYSAYTGLDRLKPVQPTLT